MKFPHHSSLKLLAYPDCFADKKWAWWSLRVVCKTNWFYHKKVLQKGLQR